LSAEDAPAPAAIHSFKAHAKEGKIHVTANVADTLKENKNRQAKLVSTGYEVGQKGLVIVGGGSGAIHSVESLREVIHSLLSSKIAERNPARLWRPNHDTLERDLLTY